MGRGQFWGLQSSLCCGKRSKVKGIDQSSRLTPQFLWTARLMCVLTAAGQERSSRRSVSTINKSRVSLRSTFSNFQVLFRYLHSFVHASVYESYDSCCASEVTTIWRYTNVYIIIIIIIVALGITIAQRTYNAVRVINRLPYNWSCWC